MRTCLVIAASTCCLALMAACGGEAEKSAPPPPPPPVAVDTPRAPLPGDSICPRDGIWRPCALVDRISRAGVGIRELEDSLQAAPLAVPGLRYRVGRQDTLTVFYYADSIASKRDFALAPRRASESAGRHQWPASATFIWNGNLIAVFQSTDARQIERIELAITAGAPYTDPRLR